MTKVRMCNEMNCQEAQNLIPSYLAAHESWLRLEDRVALEVHLAECEACWEEYEESHQAVEFLRRNSDILLRGMVIYQESFAEQPWLKNFINERV